MFGLGFGELLVVLIIALVFLGPERIPETARSLGKWIHELRGMVDEVKQSFDRDLKDTKTAPTGRKSQEQSSSKMISDTSEPRQESPSNPNPSPPSSSDPA